MGEQHSSNRTGVRVRATDGYRASNCVRFGRQYLSVICILVT